MVARTLIAVVVVSVTGCSSDDVSHHVEAVSCELLTIGGDRVREMAIGGPAAEVTGVLHLPGTTAADQLAIFADPDDAISTVESWPIVASQPIALLDVEYGRPAWPPGDAPERLIRATGPTSSPDSGDDSLAEVLAGAGRPVVMVSGDVMFDDEPTSLVDLVGSVDADGALSIEWPCRDAMRADFAQLAEMTRREPDVELLVALLSSSFGDGGLRDQFRDRRYPGVGEFGISVTPVP